MATAATIRERAAYRLGILGEGETLPSYESADLDQSYVEVYAQLGAKNVATWDFDEDVPDEFVPHVVALVAYGRTSDYPISTERYQRIVADAQRAIPEIRELQTSDTYKTPTPDYF